MNPPINYLRSAGAIFISFFVLAILDTITTAILRKFFLADQMAPPTMNHMLGVLALRGMSGLLAGYVAALLAGFRGWLHAVILAVIILSVGLWALFGAKGMTIPTYSYYTPFASALGILVGGFLRRRKTR